MSYWSQPHRAPLRNRSLSPDAIARKAVEVLDTHGPDGLTLRKLAVALGVAQSSLYGHIRSRDDVLDLALDHALLRDARTHEALFRGDLPQALLAWHAHLLRHPWTIRHVVRRTPLGPGYLALSDRICELLLDSGVGDDELLATTYSLCNFVLGCAMAQCAAEPEDPRPGDTPPGAPAGPRNSTDPPNPWSSLSPLSAPEAPGTRDRSNEPESSNGSESRHSSDGSDGGDGSGSGDGSDGSKDPASAEDALPDAPQESLPHLRRAARAQQPTWEGVVRQGIAKLLGTPGQPPPASGDGTGRPG